MVLTGTLQGLKPWTWVGNENDSLRRICALWRSRPFPVRHGHDGQGIKSAAGNKLKQILEKLTTNRIMGVLVGTLVTMIIQSSSATTVMLVGFVNAGLMNLSQAFGVMLGANIGTTITAQIIAFNISDWAPLFIILGVLPMMFGKSARCAASGRSARLWHPVPGHEHDGRRHDSAAQRGVVCQPDDQLRQPAVGRDDRIAGDGDHPVQLGFGGHLQALAPQGLVSLSAGLYIVLGCNIGTCATALLSSLGTNAMARRTADDAPDQ